MRYPLSARVSGLIVTLLFCLTAATAQTDEAQMDSSLSHLPDVRVITKTVVQSPYRVEYQLAIRQPVDHSNPAMGFFEQQLHLIHRGMSRPMVMETQGYTGSARGNELEKMLNCNNLDVEFRYFNKSRPDSLLWEYLTFEQATADLHHINQTFKKLYHQKWITTGISRGGETALTYRYFFPDDVDATVAYVAPMPNDIEDKRIYAFLDTAGGPVYSARIRKVQIFLLQHEEEALKRIPSATRNLHFGAVGGIGAAFEYAVLEYPFSFWQVSNIDPRDIPVNGKLGDYFDHMMKALGGDITLFSDEEGVMPFLPHSYMTFQTGYYKYNLQPYKSYLHYLSGPNPSAAVLPASVPRRNYDPEFEKKVTGWLARSGGNILYIYGGRDTWTACKEALDPGVNAKLFVVPGANHGRARIRFMPPAMQQDFIASLEQMTGLKADPGVFK
jgi:pimeloyl-ACP methyl ester carboxylesterase